jgi:hypothetical protein
MNPTTSVNHILISILGLNISAYMTADFLKSQHTFTVEEEKMNNNDNKSIVLIPVHTIQVFNVQYSPVLFLSLSVAQAQKEFPRLQCCNGPYALKWLAYLSLV